MYLPNIAALSTVPFPVTPDEFIVGGYYSPGDGGGGTFVWVPAPIASGDGGIVIKHPSDNLGYFKRLYSGPVNVRWFGAILGATLPGPVTITDVTAYVHAARDSSFARNGCLYFPEGNYPGAFEINFNHGSAVTIVGDGASSVLTPSGTDPVLRLGFKKSLPGNVQDFTIVKISNIVINGTYTDPVTHVEVPKYSDGVVFDDTSFAFPQLAGGWIFENVHFYYCKKAIFKPRGNFGNSFINCTWEYNEFGYYAQSYNSGGDIMHPGADKFIGGHLRGSMLAGLYLISDVDGFGQVIVDGTIIEGNPGFGIFTKLTLLSRMTGTSIEVRNVWMEANANPEINGELTGSQATPPTPSTATGTVSGSVNPRSNTVRLIVEFSGLTGTNTTTGAKLYLGIAGSIDLAAFPTNPFPLGISSNIGSPWIRSFLITQAQANELYAGNAYVEIETTGYATGEIGALLTISTVVIDGTTYAPVNLRNYRFEGVRSVSISNSGVGNIALIESSVNLYNCRSDDAGEPNFVEVGASSSLVSYEHRNNFAVSENVFVQSLSYDSTFDVGGEFNRPTSVWGPLRTTLMAGLNNVVLWSDPVSGLESTIWPGLGGDDGYATDMVDAGTCANYVDSSFIPQQNIVCKEMILNQDQIVHSPGSDFVPIYGLYYFWSIHAYLCEGEVTGWFGSELDPDLNYDQVLGQVIFKGANWACAYGIKQYTYNESAPGFNLWFRGNTDGAKFRFCHYQVLQFTELSEAISYMNSKGIAYPGTQCNGES